MDISGRHEESGEYLMVAAAVHASVGTARLESVEGMGFATSRNPPTFERAAQVVADAVVELPTPPEGPVVAEQGEFYEEPDFRVEQFLGPSFKYVESIAERETVQAAHHAAYAARKLFL
ncbi:DUF2209 family protein [Halorussus rarus]|uniref:DUF2209 family protein n=1 Tax=Halorussus TaxID=1070314 RepID=UPI000E2115A3|nr:DUF2209 family protein [Halorussus rarus]NHN59284.1 DUF2209 family protein [Halorussus sp. JP-T4]